MKVKNIVFSGFAAAVLMGIAADASAATTTQVATKAYVDRLNLDPVGADGSYIKRVRQESGQLGAEPVAFDTTITANSTHANAPTSKAVYDYITDVSDFDNLTVPLVGENGSYIKTVEQANGLVTAVPTPFDTTITANSTDNNAPTSKAVYTAIQGVTNVLDSSATVDDGKYVASVVQDGGLVTVTTGDLATSITATDQKAPTTAAVYTAIQGVTNDLDVPEVGSAGSYIQKVKQDNGEVTATPTTFDTTISDQSTDNNAPTSKAVYTAIQGVTNVLDSSATVDDGKYVASVVQDGGLVTVTTGDLATSITATELKAPTTKAVYDAIVNMPNPDECESGLCVWTSRGWLDATVPYGDEQ